MRRDTGMRFRANRRKDHADHGGKNTAKEDNRHSMPEEWTERRRMVSAGKRRREQGSSLSRREADKEEIVKKCIFSCICEFFFVPLQPNDT